jgi:hypothetical protein
VSAPAEVVESSPNDVLLRLVTLTPADAKAIKHLGGGGRLSSMLASKAHPASSSKPVEARLSKVSTAVLMLSDEMLADAAAELLGEEGIATYDVLPQGMRPDVVAATGGHLATAAKALPGVPLVAVNLTEDALVGATRLKLTAFVKKPATGASLTRALCGLLSK